MKCEWLYLNTEAETTTNKNIASQINIDVTCLKTTNNMHRKNNHCSVNITQIKKMAANTWHFTTLGIARTLPELVRVVFGISNLNSKFVRTLCSGSVRVWNFKTYLRPCRTTGHSGVRKNPKIHRKYMYIIHLKPLKTSQSNIQYVNMLRNFF